MAKEEKITLQDRQEAKEELLRIYGTTGLILKVIENDLDNAELHLTLGFTEADPEADVTTANLLQVMSGRVVEDVVDIIVGLTDNEEETGTEEVVVEDTESSEE